MTVIAPLKTIGHKWNAAREAYDVFDIAGTIELEIDVDQLLAHLGERAMKARTHRASLVYGCIKAKASRVQTIPRDHQQEEASK